MANNFRDLIEISSSIQELDSLFDMEEIDETTYNDTKEMILASMESNVDGLVFYNTSLTAKIEECKAHMKRFTEYKKYLERKQERLEKFLVEVSTVTGEKTLYGATSEIKTGKSSYVEIYDESQLPGEYLKTKIEYTPDKTKIKNDIKEGKEVPGAVISERKTIRIK